MLLGKKGILPTLVMIFALISVGAAFFYLIDSGVDESASLGKLQVDILKLGYNAERDIIYNKYLLDQNIEDYFVEFAGLGGLFNEYKTDDGYSYWVRGEIGCYPSLDDLKKNFILFLGDKFNGSYTFDVLFEDGRSKIVLRTLKEYNVSGSYYNVSFKPDLERTVHSEIDFSKLYDSVEKVKEVVELCGADVDCWNTSANFSWFNHNNLFKVEIISGSVTGAFGEKEVILKAAVDFDGANPLLGEEFKCLA